MYTRGVFLRWTFVLMLLPLTAHALDKQGSAHAYASSNPGDDMKLNVSGAVMLGAALYNPSYAARPDNTGLALMRYAGHLDLDLLGSYLSIPLDINLFTDQTRNGTSVFSPTEFDIITGMTTTWKAGPGRVEAGVRVEHDRPIDQGTFTQTYADVRGRYLYSFADIFPRLGEALLDGDIEGWATLGVFAFNPSYAARPDNTGLALFRYALHAELSLLHDYISFGLDGIMFTDRRAQIFRPSELDFTTEIIGHYGNFELHVAYERDMPVDRVGYVQQFVYAVVVWTFEVGQSMQKPFLYRGEFHSP